jgi:hypothetical protein
LKCLSVELRLPIRKGIRRVGDAEERIDEDERKNSNQSSSFVHQLDQMHIPST